MSSLTELLMEVQGYTRCFADYFFEGNSYALIDIKYSPLQISLEIFLAVIYAQKWFCSFQF